MDRKTGAIKKVHFQKEPSRKKRWEPLSEWPDLDSSPTHVEYPPGDNYPTNEDNWWLQTSVSNKTPSTSKSYNSSTVNNNFRGDCFSKNPDSNPPVEKNSALTVSSSKPVASTSRYTPKRKGGLLRSAGFLKSTKPKSSSHAKSSGSSKSPVTCASKRSPTKDTKDDKDSVEPQALNPKQIKTLCEEVPPDKEHKEPPDKKLVQKVPPDKVRLKTNKTDEASDQETTDLPNQISIGLVERNSGNYEEDTPLGIVTQQPTKRYQQFTHDQRKNTKDTRSNKQYIPTKYDSRIVEGHYYENKLSELDSNERIKDFFPIKRNKKTLLNRNPVTELDSHDVTSKFNRRELIKSILHYDLHSSIPVSENFSRQKQRSTSEPFHLNQPYPWAVPDEIDDLLAPAAQAPVNQSELPLYDELSIGEFVDSSWDNIQGPWTYEDHEHLFCSRPSYTGPRPVVLIELDGNKDETVGSHYRIEDRAVPAAPVINHRSSYYGADSPTKPFHSYLGTEEQVPECIPFQPATSRVKNIFEKNRCNYKYKGSSNFIKTMNSGEEQERKIIIEFCHLLEKSKQLFNGLRELPHYGHKQWSIYFGRTFDIYTRLWKFQQQHRAILDSKYGMKRWQIGEIASKIGQLYYHFYLRTSETAYLNEAYSFYFAIRGRCYYTKANKEDRCELMVKKLRYYARFIVVALLQNKMKLVKELIKELERQIIEYGNTYDPDDQVEWAVVVDEVKAFVHAEPLVSVVSHDNQTMILTHRLTPLTIPPVERTPQMTLNLQEVVIVGSSSQQVKVSELTMDMYRIVQTFEKEQPGDIQHIFDESPRQRFMSTPNAPNQDGMEPAPKPSNPHKALLFKPSPSQVMVYLASGCDDLQPGGVLLLYVSADGHVPQLAKHAEDDYEMGGLLTTSKNDIYRDNNKDSKSSATSTGARYKDTQCLYPGDLYPYTRWPFFIIIDSDNSYAFQNIPRHFGQPLVILMSPIDMPPCYHDPRRGGSMFTMFLQSPLEGMCYVCDLSSVPYSVWSRASILLEQFLAEASTIFVRSRLVEPTYITFFGDDFLRTLILRYVFCEVTLRLHKLFRARTHRTRCSPVLPDELFEHPTLVHIILDIANLLQVRNHIQDPATVNRDLASGGN